MATTLSIGESLSAGWKATKANIGLLIGVQIVYVLLISIPSMIGQLMIKKSPVLGGILIAAGYFLQFLLVMGMVKIGIKMVSQEPVVFGDLFSQINKVIPYFVATILFFIGSTIGLILLVVPGIILMLGWCFYPYAVVEGAGIVESLKRSWAITSGVKWKILGLMIVSGLIGSLGILALGVGLLISLPVAFLAWSHAYLTLSKQCPSA